MAKVAGQIPFGFLQELDDERDGTIDGISVTGRYYPDARTALDAIRKTCKSGERVYVVEHWVTKGFEQYWPHATYWQVRFDAPYCEHVDGAYYTGRPNHYIVVGTLELFVQGEDIKEVERKDRKAFEAFEAKESDFYSRYPHLREAWTPAHLLGGYKYHDDECKEAVQAR